jgi:uncharacterized protein (TIGR04255 family)
VSEQLGKPPIIEIWLGLHVEPDPEIDPWERSAIEILRTRFKEFPHLEAEHEQSLKLKETEGSLPEVVDARAVLNSVKIFDKDRTRCIQIAKDRIIYNSLRSGANYPGYSAVYTEAEVEFKNYADIFNPVTIRTASICYVDIVNIPLVESPSTIELGDYFEIGSDLPEDPFGVMGQFATQCIFDCPVDPGPLLLTLRSNPTPPGSNQISFRMDCQKICLNIDSLDFEVVEERLRTSKEYIHRCFKKCFTPRGWQLFEPKDIIE